MVWPASFPSAWGLAQGSVSHDKSPFQCSLPSHMFPQCRETVFSHFRDVQQSPPPAHGCTELARGPFYPGSSWDSSDHPDLRQDTGPCQDGPGHVGDLGRGRLPFWLKHTATRSPKAAILKPRPLWGDGGWGGQEIRNLSKVVLYLR